MFSWSLARPRSLSERLQRENRVSCPSLARSPIAFKQRLSQPRFHLFFLLCASTSFWSFRPRMYACASPGELHVRLCVLSLATVAAAAAVGRWRRRDASRQQVLPFPQLRGVRRRQRTFLRRNNHNAINATLH